MTEVEWDGTSMQQQISFQSPSPSPNQPYRTFSTVGLSRTLHGTFKNIPRRRCMGPSYPRSCESYKHWEKGRRRLVTKPPAEFAIRKRDRVCWSDGIRVIVGNNNLLPRRARWVRQAVKEEHGQLGSSELTSRTGRTVIYPILVPVAIGYD